MKFWSKKFFQMRCYTLNFSRIFLSKFRNVLLFVNKIIYIQLNIFLVLNLKFYLSQLTFFNPLTAKPLYRIKKKSSQLLDIFLYKKTSKI